MTEGAQPVPDSVLPRRIRGVVVALVLLAATIVLWRQIDINGGRPGDRSAAFEVGVTLAITVDDPAFRAHIGLPRDTAERLLYRQSFEYAGLVVRRSGTGSASRDIELRASEPGNYTFRASLGVLYTGRAPEPAPPRPQSNETGRSRYLDVDLNDPDTERYRFLFGQKPRGEREAGKVVAAAEQAVRQVMKWGKLAGERDAARAFVWFCRTRGVPARLVTGVRLAERESGDLEYWSEAYVGGAWRVVDFQSGGANARPLGYLGFRRDREELFQIEGAGSVQVRTAVRRTGVPPWLRENGSSWYDALDLSQGSLERREVLGLLLVLPLGVLITIIARRFLGLSVFGTFGPTLLALGVTATDPISFVVVTAVVLTFSLTGRRALSALELARIPRVGIVFTLVTVILAFCFAIMDFLSVDTGDDNVFVPLAVLTILVDQFSTTAQKSGTAKAMFRLAQTSIVTAVIVVVLTIDGLTELLASMPELHLLTIAAILVFGTTKWHTRTPAEDADG